MEKTVRTEACLSLQKPPSRPRSPHLGGNDPAPCMRSHTPEPSLTLTWADLPQTARWAQLSRQIAPRHLDTEHQATPTQALGPRPRQPQESLTLDQPLSPTFPEGHWDSMCFDRVQLRAAEYVPSFPLPAVTNSTDQQPGQQDWEEVWNDGLTPWVTESWHQILRLHLNRTQISGITN